ncbi:rod shape-determining protein MreC [Fusobacterium sp.]|uniref:rod shape-determining protein MreC n=1 Tax=Fusobacterium sp. TaxID=68766 RepID=UPI00262BBB8C|nr:rod shape-determining protein MreC [Fusobacterium sp.]
MKLKKKKRTLIGWVYIIVIGVAVLFFMKGLLLFGMKKLNVLILPIQSKIYTTTEGIRENFNTILKYKDFFYENRELKAKITSQEYKDELIADLTAENVRLRQLLDLKGQMEYKTKVVKVSFQHVQDTYDGFVIKAGAVDGMKVNMPVLSGRQLIGKITDVYENYSVVKMITGENSYVSVLCRDVIGIVNGEREKDLYFRPTSSLEEDLKVGEELYTSGISDVYPKGLYVGKISEIVSANNKLEKRYKVKIDTNIYDFQEAIVLMGDV